MVADVTIVGAGIVGLTSAIALADRGARVRVVGVTRHGNASEAAGGLLAPFIEPELASIADIAVQARDGYVDYAAMLGERSGIPVPINRLGALQVALEEHETESLPRAMAPVASWLDARALRDLEPALGHALGAVFTPDDGCLDPLLLMDALRTVVARHSGITVANEDVCSVHVTADEGEVVTNQEGHYSSPALVLAAGVWTPSLPGLPTPLPVEPVGGQMLSFRGVPVSRITFGAGGYLVPKDDGHTIAGSTLEHTGLETGVTDAGRSTITNMTFSLCPAVAAGGETAAWAGLRPMTPDLLPIIAADPEHAHIVYACGHSRNGILLAPYTAELAADLVMHPGRSEGEPRFRLGRF